MNHKVHQKNRTTIKEMIATLRKQERYGKENSEDKAQHIREFPRQRRGQTSPTETYVRPQR
jgi:hypothetical protein